MAITEYTLDISKWRCGCAGDPANALGKGVTMMLNPEGYMCCLGQFALQAGVPIESLRQAYNPVGTADGINKEYDSNFVTRSGITERFYTTDLGSELISINDDEYTTIREKIKLIETQFAQRGLTLKVIDDGNLLD